MAVTRAKRAANDKWDAANMKHIACKVRKEDADAFKKYADERNTNPNALLKGFVYRCIGKEEPLIDEAIERDNEKI